MVTTETLKAKRAELQQAYDTALAQMNSFSGALQFCDHLISEMENEPKKEQVKDANNPNKRHRTG